MVRCEYGIPFWSILFFYSFVDGLVPRYPELFEGGGVTSQHQLNFGKKWRGYETVVALAQDNILLFGEVLQKPLEECLLYLAYISDKGQLEKLLQKEQMNRYKTY